MSTVVINDGRTWIDGIPSKITKEWFRTRYGQNFPDLLDSTKDTFLNTCIDDVYTLFAGIPDFWKHLKNTIYYDKTQMCYGLLTAWYITDMFPDFAVGVVSAGSGLAVKRKKIGNTDITFGEVASTAGSYNNADLLQSLKSNAFGVKAYMMIKTSGKINLFLQR